MPSRRNTGIIKPNLTPQALTRGVPTPRNLGPPKGGPPQAPPSAPLGPPTHPQSPTPPPPPPTPA